MVHKAGVGEQNECQKWLSNETKKKKIFTYTKNILDCFILGDVWYEFEGDYAILLTTIPKSTEASSAHLYDILLTSTFEECEIAQSISERSAKCT